MITIQGLTPLQRQIADLIWHCNSKEDVDLLIKSMPSVEYKRTAETMLEMIIWAALDEALEDHEVDYKAAKKILSRFQLPRE